MFKKLKLLFFLTLICSLKIFSQSSVLTGKINDETNNQPLAGATISIGSAKKNVSAQSDGTYNIQGLVPGKYTLLVSYIGYDSKKIADVEIIKGETTTLNITLTPSKNSSLT